MTLKTKNKLDDVSICIGRLIISLHYTEINHKDLKSTVHELAMYLNQVISHLTEEESDD